MDEQQPITPLTGPVFDDEGRLTYMGVDGRRYVVVDGVDFDEQDAAKVMKVLQLAGGVFEEIEQHCQQLTLLSVDKTSVTDASITEIAQHCQQLTPL